MEENRFDVLTDVLKIMDTDATRHADLDDGIKNVLSHFDNTFTSDQKNEVVKEIRKFSAEKQDKKERQILRKRIDEERYREMLENFINTDVGD
ncbi:hypothetical protein ACFLQN_02060 [Candidatus Aenigmatarchaeota archaeon]